ncbi:MAG: hypothetical protein HYR88_04610 [Verrucomicrobia bacterium]|nr:hypothetical protein [Verrucomicrobiota bacterium]MBI3867081.1 hypothetical protein [Verrucomicrobiota bacterium]
MPLPITNPRRCWIRLSTLLFLLPPALFSAEIAALRLSSPLDYQVFQRSTGAQGKILFRGALPETARATDALEVRFARAGESPPWTRLARSTDAQSEWRAEMDAPAGGWHRVEVRISRQGSALAAGVVEHVGVGEVFVVLGQSNAANHGEEKLKTATGLVAALSDQGWRLSEDPQPGASGGGGSFIPAFGDEMARRFHVPIGVVAGAVGATSVREWLPRGSRFPNPPTLTGHVTHRAEGDWESKGDIHESTIARLKPLGRRGFRAVLWHQGESDANQRDTSRTLPGDDYQRLFLQLARRVRSELGWEFPWFVAQASYHTPDDPGSADIRSAQAALWTSGIALPGPDTDALTGDFRDSGGKGVHFSGKGLREHGRLWAEKVAPWLEAQLKQ